MSGERPIQYGWSHEGYGVSMLAKRVRIVGIVVSMNGPLVQQLAHCEQVLVRMRLQQRRLADLRIQSPQ
jgi:hypothetical protein